MDRAGVASPDGESPRKLAPPGAFFFATLARAQIPVVEEPQTFRLPVSRPSNRDIRIASVTTAMSNHAPQ